MIKRRSLIINWAITAFVIFFQYIYQLFGHGIHSNFMTFSWILPAVLSIIYTVFFLLKKKFSQNAYAILNCGSATITLGLIIHGVFDIAGTSSIFMMVYWIAGGILLIAGCVTFLVDKPRMSHRATR